jgi:lipoprotein-releasing system permease protein
MGFSGFIAKRMGSSNGKSFTRLIIRFAVAGIGLSLAVMILSIGIVLGFKDEIRQKIVGFGGHIQIGNLDLNSSKEARLIPIDSMLLQKISATPGVKHIYPFTGKAGILQREGQIEGLYFKGVPSTYSWDFFKGSLTKGRIPFLKANEDTYEVMISEITAKRMKLDTGMTALVYFIQDGQVRMRNPMITGVFNTGLAEFDQKAVIADMRMIQRINGQGYDSISGYEIVLNNFKRMGFTTLAVNRQIDYNLKARSAADLNSIIFDWLEIIDTNAIVIIILMIIVAIINMCTALLILIVERTGMIGILKALGATNRQVRKIFIRKGLKLVMAGLVIGNGVGLFSGWLLERYKIFRLDEEIYYMDAVPFMFNIESILMLNAGTVLVCSLVMFIPVIMVNGISPVKAIRFS